MFNVNEPTIPMKRRALFHLASKQWKSSMSRHRLNARVASLIRAKDQRANHSARGQLGISKSKGTANTLSLWRNDDSCLSRSRNVERAGSDIDRICLCLLGRQRARFPDIQRKTVSASIGEIDLWENKIDFDRKQTINHYYWSYYNLNIRYHLIIYTVKNIIKYNEIISL